MHWKGNVQVANWSKGTCLYVYICIHVCTHMEKESSVCGCTSLYPSIYLSIWQTYTSMFLTSAIMHIHSSSIHLCMNLTCQEIYRDVTWKTRPKVATLMLANSLAMSAVELVTLMQLTLCIFSCICGALSFQGLWKHECVDIVCLCFCVSKWKCCPQGWWAFNTTRSFHSKTHGQNFPFAITNTQTSNIYTLMFS